MWRIEEFCLGDYEAAGIYWKTGSYSCWPSFLSLSLFSYFLYFSTFPCFLISVLFPVFSHSTSYFFTFFSFLFSYFRLPFSLQSQFIFSAFFSPFSFVSLFSSSFQSPVTVYLILFLPLLFCLPVFFLLFFLLPVTTLHRICFISSPSFLFFYFRLPSSPVTVHWQPRLYWRQSARVTL